MADRLISPVFILNHSLDVRKNKNKGGETMSKKGIKNSSMEQIKKDHETETAFNVDNPKKQQKK